MGKQSSRGRGRSRSQNRRPAAKKPSTLGYRLLLIGCLLVAGVWILMRIPSGFLIGGSIVVLILVLLFLIIWFALRYRLTPEEQRWYKKQQIEAVHMEETAQAIDGRPVELPDLAHLSDKEFEYFTGALLEAMGVLFEWECVGGNSDHGIDLRGKNQYGLPLVVQCKHFFGHNVTPDKTRDFGWTLGLHEADEAWFVTTSFFSKQARADVGKLTFKGHMKLVDGKTLIDYIHDHWDTVPAQWQWRLTECMVERDHRGHAEIKSQA